MMGIVHQRQLIVEQHVTNAATDMGLLATTAGAARDTLGVECIAAVADMGYHKGEDIAACAANGITPYAARPQRGNAIGNRRFSKGRFSYDPAGDASSRYPLPIGRAWLCVDPASQQGRLRD